VHEELAELGGECRSVVAQPVEIRPSSEQRTRRAGDHAFWAGVKDSGDVHRCGALRSDTGREEQTLRSYQVECRLDMGGTDDGADRPNLTGRQSGVQGPMSRSSVASTLRPDSFRAD
jgi:hypothetical protein